MNEVRKNLRLLSTLLGTFANIDNKKNKNDKTIDDSFFLIYAGIKDFKNNKHLHNFIKYLFGSPTSLRHKPNEFTKNNVFVENYPIGTEFKFTINPMSDYNKFKNKFWKSLHYNTLINDVHYVFFVLELNGKLISNFVDNKQNNEPVINTTKELYSVLLQRYFCDDENLFNKYLENIYKKYNNQIVNYEDVTRDERMFIEKKIHDKIYRDRPCKTLISICHTDQIEEHPMYHIHRLIEERV